MDAGFAYEFTLNMARGLKQDVKGLNTAIQTIAENTAKSEESQRKVQDIIKQQNKLFAQQQSVTNGIAANIAQFKMLAGVAAGILGVTHAIKTLTDAGEHLDNMLTKHRIAFGGYTNALSAYKQFQAGVAEGNLFGTAEEFMDSSSMLMRKGIHMTQEMTQTLNDWASASGQSVTDVAQAINSAIEGNTSAFESFGITDSTMKQFSRFTGNTNAMRDAVLDFVKAQKQFNDGAKNAPVTWKNIAQRMKAMKDRFVEAIIGHANDPNSLNNMVKRTIDEVLDFLNKNAKFFKALATGISATLKWIFKQVGNFVMWIVDGAQKSIDSIQNYMNNYKDRIAGFILFLELMKLRVIDFFNANKKTIMLALKLFAMYKVARMALAIPIAVINSVRAYWLSIKLLHTALNQNKYTKKFLDSIKQAALAIWRQLIPAITSWITAQWGLNVAMDANPIGLIILAIAAAVAQIAAFIYVTKWLINNWRVVLNSFTDFGKTYPAIKLIFDFLTNNIRLSIYYFMQWFDLIKQVGILIYNSLLWAFTKIKGAIYQFGIYLKGFFVNMANGVYEWFVKPVVEAVRVAFAWIWENLMPDWLKDFGGWLLRSLQSVGGSIASFFAAILDYINPTKWFNSAKRTVAQANNAIVADLEKQGVKGGVKIDETQFEDKPQKNAWDWGIPSLFGDWSSWTKETPVAVDKGVKPAPVTNDNSMEFSENSIQINLQGAGDSEKDALNIQKELEKLMKSMQRKSN
jgi:hypothetical protein